MNVKQNTKGTISKQEHKRSTYTTKPTTQVKPEKVSPKIEGDAPSTSRDPTANLRRGSGLPSYSSSFPRGPNGKFLSRKNQQSSNAADERSSDHHHQQISTPPPFSTANQQGGYGNMMGYNNSSSRNYSYYPSNAPGQRLC